MNIYVYTCIFEEQPSVFSTDGCSIKYSFCICIHDSLSNIHVLPYFFPCLLQLFVAEICFETVLAHPGREIKIITSQ